MSEKLNRQTAIAHRSFEVQNQPQEQVDVFIGKPFEIEEYHWACPYRIVGAGQDMNFQIYGVDSIQALQLAFQVIDSAIEGAELELLWGEEKFLGFCN